MKKSLFVQIKKRIGCLLEKEIIKANILKDGTYSISLLGENYYFSPDNPIISPLEEGHTSLQEIEGYFSNPYGKKLILRQSFEADRKQFKYHLTLKKLEETLETCKGKDVDWKTYFYVATNIDSELHKLDKDFGYNPKDLFFYKEEGAIYCFLDDLRNGKDVLQELKAFNSSWYERKEERHYSVSMLERMIEYFFEDHEVDIFSNPEDTAFAFNVLDTLYEKNPDDMHLLSLVADNEYLGTPLKEPDIKKAKEKYISLLEKGKSFAANNLGYIALYHPEGDKPSYSEAFRYFSIGASFGIRESKMKLADILSEKESPVYAPSLAKKIYMDIFEEAKEEFSFGDTLYSKFPELALRMYYLYSDPKYGMENEEHAIGYLLSAKLAIKERLYTHPGIRDDIFFAEKVSSLLKKHPRRENAGDVYPLITEEDCLFAFNELYNSKSEHKTLLQISYAEERDGYFFFIINDFDHLSDGPESHYFVFPRINLAFFSDKICFKCKIDSSMELNLRNKLIDGIRLHPIEGSESFELEFFGLDGKEKVFIINEPEIILPDDLGFDKKIKIITVSVPKYGNKTLEVVSEDKLAIGDNVHFLGEDGETIEGVVVSIDEKFPTDLELPLVYYNEAYKNSYHSS